MYNNKLHIKKMMETCIKEKGAYMYSFKADNEDFNKIKKIYRNIFRQYGFTMDFMKKDFHIGLTHKAGHWFTDLYLEHNSFRWGHSKLVTMQ